MNKITSIIVDDEKLAREYIKNLLVSYPQIEILAEASDGHSAITLISELEPDIVFLDIQMPLKTGIDVIQHMHQDYQPIYIFVTAYDEYAIEAFDNNAIDYLLKPFDAKRFDKSIQKALELLSNIHLKENYHKLLDLFSTNYKSEFQNTQQATGPNTTPRLALKSNGKIELVDQNDIKWIQSDAYLLNIHCQQKKYVITGKLKDIEEQLDTKVFVRIHRSVIVNINYIQSFRPTGTGSYEVFLKDKTKLKLSRRRKNIIDNILGNNS